MTEAPLHIDIAEAPADGQAFWVETTDKVRIRFALWRDKDMALILPGRGEYIEKYGRIVTKLRNLNMGCIVIDWRNQGLSDRKSETGHVADYQDYQLDLDAVLAHPAVREIGSQFHLVAHSMGGLIALRTIRRGLPFKSAVFSAPMWGMGLHPTLRSALKLLSGVAVSTGLGKARVVGTNKDPYIRTADPENNTLMRSINSAQWFRAQLEKHPELGLGGPSWAWLQASHKEIQAMADFDIPDLPTLTLLGDHETVVSPIAITERIATPANGDLIIFEGARHEVLMEDGEIEKKALAALKSHWAAASAVQ